MIQTIIIVVFADLTIWLLGVVFGYCLAKKKMYKAIKKHLDKNPSIGGLSLASDLLEI